MARTEADDDAQDDVGRTARMGPSGHVDDESSGSESESSDESSYDSEEEDDDELDIDDENFKMEISTYQSVMSMIPLTKYWWEARRADRALHNIKAMHEETERARHIVGLVEAGLHEDALRERGARRLRVGARRASRVVRVDARDVGKCTTRTWTSSSSTR